MLMSELSEIKLYARKNDVPIMQDETQQFICDYIRQHKCTKILEIGSAIGYSAIQFAQAALSVETSENQQNSNVNVTTIEIDLDRYLKAVQNIKSFDLEKQITIINDNALDTVLDTKFQLIFIDAAKAQYIKFFEKYKNNLAEDGVIISDNLHFHGMVDDLSLTHNYSTIKLVKKIRKYINFLKENKEFNTEFFDLGDGISVSKRIS